MITNSTLVFVDWDSARRIIRKGAGEPIIRRPDRDIEAAIEALCSGEPYVEAMRQEYDRRRRTIVDGFNRLGLNCFEPGQDQPSGAPPGT